MPRACVLEEINDMADMFKSLVIKPVAAKPAADAKAPAKTLWGKIKSLL